MDIGHKKIPRGTGWFNTGAAVAEANWGESARYEGTLRTFADHTVAATYGPKELRSPGDVVCRLVRNASGITLSPKRLVNWKAGYRLKRVDGYTRTTACEVAGVTDEHFPSSGIPDGEMFWLAVKGHTLVKTSRAASAAETAWSAGARLVALTAATSQAVTAGRISPINLTGATENLANQILNNIGKAVSAITSGQTDSDCLVEVDLL